MKRIVLLFACLQVAAIGAFDSGARKVWAQWAEQERAETGFYPSEQWNYNETDEGIADHPFVESLSALKDDDLNKFYTYMKQIKGENNNTIPFINIILNAHGQSETLLGTAAKEGLLAEVQFILEQSGSNPNVANKQGQTPLMLAFMGGEDAVIALLMKYGANPFLKDTRNWTIVDYAKRHKRGKLVEKLIPEVQNEYRERLKQHMSDDTIGIVEEYLGKSGKQKAMPDTSAE